MSHCCTNLTGIISRFSASAKTTGRQYEYFLGDRIDFAYAFRVTDDGDFGFSDSQRDRTGLAHVPVPRHRAPLASRVIDAPGWQTHQTHAVLQLGLTV